jgi:hypothetical protein
LAGADFLPVIDAGGLAESLCRGLMGLLIVPVVVPGYSTQGGCDHLGI